MKNYKVYGNESTNLELTEKAQVFYDETDPLEIRERADGLYDIIGAVEAHDLIAEKVNALFENLYSEIFED